MTTPKFRIPNPIGIPFGSNRVELLREADGTFVATLVLLKPYYVVEYTNRVARRAPGGVVTGDPELVAAFPDLLRQRDELTQYLLTTRAQILRIKALEPVILSNMQAFTDAVVEHARELHQRAQAELEAGRIAEHQAAVDELARLRRDFEDLLGPEIVRGSLGDEP